eukprot:TRINITY_DN6490_c0_g1_i1.p3 TRINITY_DN6490_c0_g1~~TRINITY_DN6490_c0_g1_i1.p3  ORF type:complete len:134 (-),score=22.05 TRINITY_DN6490_c0_g1_i1:227-628(-)
MNTRGGTIYGGLDDFGIVKGLKLSRYTIDRITETIDCWIASSLELAPTPMSYDITCVPVTDVPHGGSRVVVGITFERAPLRYVVGGHAYGRTPSSTRALSQNQIAELEEQWACRRYTKSTTKEQEEGTTNGDK